MFMVLLVADCGQITLCVCPSTQADDFRLSVQVPGTLTRLWPTGTDIVSMVYCTCMVVFLKRGASIIRGNGSHSHTFGFAPACP